METEESLETVPEVISQFKTTNTNVSLQREFASFDTHCTEKKTELTYSIASRSDEHNPFRRTSSLSQENRNDNQTPFRRTQSSSQENRDDDQNPFRRIPSSSQENRDDDQFRRILTTSPKENQRNPPDNAEQRIIFVDTEFGTCLVVFKQDGQRRLNDGIAEELRERILEAVKKVICEFKFEKQEDDKRVEDEPLPEDDYYYYKEIQQDVNGHAREEYKDVRPKREFFRNESDDGYPNEVKRMRSPPRKNVEEGGKILINRKRRSSRSPPLRQRSVGSSRSPPPSRQRPPVGSIPPRPLLPVSELRRENQAARNASAGRGYHPSSRSPPPSQRRPPNSVMPLMSTRVEPPRESDASAGRSYQPSSRSPPPQRRPPSSAVPLMSARLEPPEDTVDKLTEFFDDPNFGETVAKTATKAILALYGDQPVNKRPSPEPSAPAPPSVTSKGKMKLKPTSVKGGSKTLGKPKSINASSSLKMRPSASGSVSSKEASSQVMQKCLRCLKRGHYASTCRSTVFKCQKCGLMGHSILDEGGCPYADKGRCCYICKEFGHFSLNCPMKHARNAK